MGEVAAKLGQPGAHVGKALGVGDGVAQDAGVSSPVVETRDGPKPFLAGCKWAEKDMVSFGGALEVRQSRPGVCTRDLTCLCPRSGVAQRYRYRYQRRAWS